MCCCDEPDTSKHKHSGCMGSIAGQVQDTAVLSLVKGHDELLSRSPLVYAACYTIRTRAFAPNALTHTSMSLIPT